MSAVVDRYLLRYAEMKVAGQRLNEAEAAALEAGATEEQLRRAAALIDSVATTPPQHKEEG